MNTDNKTYARFAEKRAKKSPVLQNCARAFTVGGAICCVGHALRVLWSAAGLPDNDSGMMASVTLILAAALLTGFGRFDEIAKFAGAGTLVPITGFANAVAATAIESRSEGLVTGVGAKLFTVAGPVIVYGLSAGTIYGAVYFVLTRLS